MDGARLPASGYPYLSPRQTCLLQPRGFMGRRAASTLGSGGGTLIGRCGRSYADHPVLIESRDNCQRLRARLTDKLPTIYLGDGEVAGLGLGGACGAAPGEPCGPGVGGGLASSSSTSKIRVALGPSSGLTDRSPYARFDGTNT